MAARATEAGQTVGGASGHPSIELCQAVKPISKSGASLPEYCQSRSTIGNNRKRGGGRGSSANIQMQGTAKHELTTAGARDWRSSLEARQCGSTSHAEMEQEHKFL